MLNTGDCVLRKRGCVWHNGVVDVRITSTARRRGLSSSRIREALPGAVFDHMDGDMAIYHGVDARGLALELGLVADDRRPGELACVHAMPLTWRNR